MNTLIQDVRYALRQLRKSAGFSATVIITMALGVGANVIVFAMLNAMVLKPLDLPEAKQLMFLNRHVNATLSVPAQSYPDYLDLREKNVVFSGIVAMRINPIGIEHNGVATKSWMTEASDNYFDVLGVKPLLGRFFHAGENRGANSMPYVVLSYDYWKTHMNSDPAIVGQVIRLNTHPFTVIGVAPASFQGTELFFRQDLWAPMVNEAQLEGDSYLESRGSHGIWLTGRVKPGVTAKTAEANLNAIADQLSKQYPEDDKLNFGLSRPGFLGDFLGGPVRAFLLGLMLLAGLVLLAACANLGSLFAARVADRARELALRLALGSTRKRIVRQLVTESLLLALLGGGAGLFVGSALLRGLSHFQVSSEFPIQIAVAADRNVYLLALVLSVLSGLFFGLAPAAQIWRNDAYQAIKSGQTAVFGKRRWTLRDVLLVVQIVLCSVLVTSSLVAVRGLVRSLHTSFGFQPNNVTLANFDLKMAGYTPEQANQFQHRLVDAVAQIPGVTAAGFSNTTPLSLDSSDSSAFRDGTTDFRPSNAAADALVYDVSPGYLMAAQTRLLAGRDFTWHDDAKAPKVAIVNETFARQVFGTTQALGRYFLYGDRRCEVVGIVENGKYRSITEDAAAAMFFPIPQEMSRQTILVVRSTNGAQAAAAVQHILSGMDASVPVALSSWQQELGVALFPSEAATFALGILGLLAAMLALTGVFGMASYSVSRRLRELGIRMAMGAQRKQILRAALGRPIQLLVFGSLGGLLVGALASRVLASIVYQATPRDPLVLLGVLLGMSSIGLFAAWIPARRALGVEPSLLLRQE
jgi:predicted permease